jgi:hypothetical protein
MVRLADSSDEAGLEEAPLLPLPKPLPLKETKVPVLEKPESVEAGTSEGLNMRGGRPGDRLRELLGGLESEGSARLDNEAFLHRLYQSAASLRDPRYTLRAFHDDMTACFPELRLYLGVAGAAGAVAGTTTSGRSGAEEYIRTIGALFAVYWLCRLNLPSVPGSESLDGQLGFCFGAAGAGASEDWAPPPLEVVETIAPVEPLTTPTPPQRRMAFFEAMDWEGLHRLFCDSGVLISRQDGSASVDIDRAAAMLALTAIHDVMKVEALLPVVTPDDEHTEFAGHTAGDIIHDHDLALGYVLTHDPTALPCFAALPESLQRPIRFTQAKLGFNHGWLVQAEAPPGVLFNSFKQLITAEGVAAADIAFYFVHWVTDLAGAEPDQRVMGAQQFTCKFPRAVLASFVRSFPLVQRLSHLTCTELNEEFLVEWWPTAVLGASPSGATAIAQHRLIVQAQTADRQREVLSAWTTLPPADKKVLAEELARTGVAGEAYARSPQTPAGPAFLVYYSPAFVRQADDDTRFALRALSAVYRAARKMWPLDEAAAGGSVIVRIDQLKGRRTVDIGALHTKGSCWVLRRQHSAALEGNVESCALSELVSVVGGDGGAGNVEVVHLWELRTGEGGQGGDTSSVLTMAGV